MHTSDLRLQSTLATLAICLLLLTLWLCLHGYHGLTDDGQIYAFQAFARIHPQLAADLYLQYTSQDQFTFFSPFYTCFIGLFGLEEAARFLTLCFTLLFLAAAWSFVAAIGSRNAAWLAVAFLLIAAGDYGASGVFRIIDPFLTARLPAEACAISALACYVRGMKRCAALLAFGAIFIHPLISLPGFLLIICLGLPIRVSIVGSVVAIFSTLAVALVAVNLPANSPILSIMDAAWLEVVRERSQFLFLQLWSIKDWRLNALPFISIGFTAAAVAAERIRKLCAVAALVGATGLVIAFIGGLIGPVALIVQCQPWRWIWVVVLIAAAFMPLTVLTLSRNQKCGPLCALLLVSGWALPGNIGIACIIFASILWLSRERVDFLPKSYFRWIFAALCGVIVIWILMKCWVIVSSALYASQRAPLGATLQKIFQLKFPALLFAALIWWGIRANRSTWLPASLSAVLAAISLLTFPAAFKQPRLFASAAITSEFADWVNAIPPTSTVLVVPPRDVGAFVWFTLGRPNYLTVDQSSGVVFSRDTALEVRRRSEILAPLMEPNWRILTRLRSMPGAVSTAATRPLTRGSLIQVCQDLQLGFVVSPENVGFDPLRHEHAGAWKDWNLYDCGKVRSASSAT